MVGEDSLGNQYYEQPRKPNALRSKRWIIYNGTPEGSKGSPQWYGWLHHTIQQPPSSKNEIRYKWQKPPQPNLTGTVFAYKPPVLPSNTPLDYTPWNPTN
ncbi:MAG: NADH:ubiquinone oxidoreductase subunit NDUFA12 [Alphaproteobacteria bacterium]|nr:NADH:ubiquinone oxidoreductase subunit NDUFA12 [Alphaproteobacteria bacterium]MBT5654383.1 NADH:ubiquinone oxidoreductase subunit NDUFA12 [Alphaproteobacteria bacterium]